MSMMMCSAIHAIYILYMSLFFVFFFCVAVPRAIVQICLQFCSNINYACLLYCVFPLLVSHMNMGFFY